MTKGGNRVTTYVVNKFHPIFGEFFQHVETELKYEFLKYETGSNTKTSELILELNNSYDEYLEEKKTVLSDLFKEDKSIDRDLLFEYLLNSTENMNVNLLSHYFQDDDSTEKLELGEIVGFNSRFEDLYLELLIILMYFGMRKND